jgi:hypothetical protein
MMMSLRLLALVSIVSKATSWQWDTIPLTGMSLPFSSGSSVTYWSGDGTASNLIISGGQSSNGTELQGCYIVDTDTWNIFFSFADTPADHKRTQHTSSMFGQIFLLIFGSGDLTNPSVPDVYKSGVWALTPASFYSSIPIVARYGHSGIDFPISVGDTILYQHVVFGGMTLLNNSDLNDVLILSAVSGSLNFNWTVPSCTGAVPSPRHYHAATFFQTIIDGISTSTMVVFGGTNAEGVVFDDLYLFILDGISMYSWRKQATIFSTPSYGHRISIINGYMVLFGGSIANTDPIIRALDLATFNWKVPNVINSPSTSNSFPYESAGISITSTDKSQLFFILYGGINRASKQASNTIVKLSDIGIDPKQADLENEVDGILIGVTVSVFALAIFGFVLYRWRNRRSSVDNQYAESRLLIPYKTSGKKSKGSMVTHSSVAVYGGLPLHVSSKQPPREKRSFVRKLADIDEFDGGF